MSKQLTRRQMVKQKLHCEGYDVARFNLKETAQQLRLRADSLKEAVPALASAETDALTEFPSKMMFAGLFEMKPFSDGVVIRFLTKKYPNRVIQHGFVFPDNDEPSHHASLVSGLYTPSAPVVENGLHEIADRPANHPFADQLLGKVMRSAMLDWENLPKVLLHVAPPELPEARIPEQRQTTVDITDAVMLSGRLGLSGSL